LYSFADAVYSADETDSRKLKFLYRHSGIDTRYSVIPDFSLPKEERTLFAKTDDLEPFPGIEDRMIFYNRIATPMSVEAIENCIREKIDKKDITHLITVSCTGMSAPGLDLNIMETMALSPTLVRTSVNFMGCYAAIHAMKLADAFCRSTPHANVVVVCTELCTLHFQKEVSADNITASLLFADGSAAILFQNEPGLKGIQMEHFYSQVSFKGRKDMAWEISSRGFLMTLTGFVPDLIKEDFEQLVTNALASSGVSKDEITHWCIHPGGKKILDTIVQSLHITTPDLHYS
jgi:predicted naringenin-chalcone synthase